MFPSLTGFILHRNHVPSHQTRWGGAGLPVAVQRSSCFVFPGSSDIFLLYSTGCGSGGYAGHLLKKSKCQRTFFWINYGGGWVWGEEGLCLSHFLHVD